jgi:hypothetical protein
MTVWKSIDFRQAIGSRQARVTGRPHRRAAALSVAMRKSPHVAKSKSSLVAS